MHTARIALVVVFALLLPALAHADDPPPGDQAPKVDPRARAQQLFDSALVDAEAGNFAAACPKFLASQEADPKTSTLLNLANCYEKNGQTASAWGAFREAETRARKAARSDWETSARARAEALEPKLHRLTIVVDDGSRVAGLSVTRDGAHLGAGEWGVAIPVDPGEHTIVASAEGRKPWETKVTVGGTPNNTEPTVGVSIPVLEMLPSTQPLLPVDNVQPVTPPKRGWSTWKTIGVAGAGVGVAGLAVGGLLGLVAKGDYNSARARCRDGAKGCPEGAVSDADSAYGLASGATVVFVIGAALLAGGAALFILDPGSSNTNSGSASSPRVALSPTGLLGNW